VGRVAVFVDAGYFYARATEALAGETLSRRIIDLDEAILVRELISLAKSATEGTLLRVYWYDGAAVTGLSPEQIRIAEIDNVKLRLGVINTYGQQKGVDSLIVTDMIDLARNHAIDSVVLMSGDEDVRVAVTIVQAYGVRVHLLGIKTETGTAQSRALVREVDTNPTWDVDVLRRFAKARINDRLVIPTATARRPVEADNEPFETAAPPLSVRVASDAEIQSRKPTEDPSEGSSEAAARINGAVEVFLATLTSADRDDILLVFENEKRFPIYHDRRLLGAVGRAFVRPLSVDERRAMRKVALGLLRASANAESANGTSADA